MGLWANEETPTYILLKKLDSDKEVAYIGNYGVGQSW